MNILSQIIAYKKKEVKERKELYPVKLLEKSIYFQSPCVSLKKYLLREDKAGIIAEFKRRSPSKGIINAYAPVERTSIGYMQAGASALSILTDTEFFGGKNEDIITARKFNYCPILRKDFIIDEYQVVEAKSTGADVILLLANVLSSKEIKLLVQTAKSLGMEILLELRNKNEMESLIDEIDCAGVNNRDLENFTVSTERSFELADLIPGRHVKISESGISSPKMVHDLRKAGFRGFLIGELFMRHSRPELACAQFISEVKALGRLK